MTNTDTYLCTNYCVLIQDVDLVARMNDFNAAGETFMNMDGEAS
jgi:hypothetical protein